jgi:hypothetical protein
MEEYLGNPFAATPEAGKQMVIISDSPPWLHCHHKFFPAYWQCKACPPNRCFNGWDLKALYQSSRDYQPSCSRQGCAASVTSETVLVNTQKESIMTLGGENLMPSRFEASFMWCCECGGLRQAGRNQSDPCSHCVDFQESDCGECLWCNKFLEPTEFPTGILSNGEYCTSTAGRWQSRKAVKFQISCTGHPVSSAKRVTKPARTLLKGAG